MYDMKEWEKSAEFHGHICPGLAFGFKAAMIALKELGVERARDEELIAVVENDACGVDAIQVVTGCSLGKGNLIYRDFGKQVYTFGNRKTGEAVRVATRPGIMDRDPEHRMLFAKIMANEATPEEREKFWEMHHSLSQFVLNMAEDEFCEVKKVDFSFPEKARIFNSVVCEECGESAAESRVRIKDGKKVCLQCAGAEYTRGW
jgi:formylmethanofuran dehydrogenase subunit E